MSDRESLEETVRPPAPHAQALPKTEGPGLPIVVPIFVGLVSYFYMQWTYVSDLSKRYVDYFLATHHDLVYTGGAAGLRLQAFCIILMPHTASLLAALILHRWEPTVARSLLFGSGIAMILYLMFVGWYHLP